MTKMVLNFIMGLFSVIEFLVNLFSRFMKTLFHSIYIRLRVFILNNLGSGAFPFFLQIGFIVMSFCLFLFCDKLMFPHLEKVSNPIQVVAQLACFFFLFKYKDIRLRHLCLLSFVLTLLSSLYLKRISWFILFFLFLFYLIIICFFPLDSDVALFILFSFYYFDPGMSKWGFYLVFQQFCFFLLTCFFKKEQPCPRKRLLYFGCIEAFLLCNGFFNYNEFYLAEPLKFAVLLSGACIIYISFERRTIWELFICFFLYFTASIIIAIYISAIYISPTERTTILGISSGMFIFVSVHFWAFLCLLFLWGYLPNRRKQAFVPLFYSGLFFLLGNFSEPAWLERWVEGIDLLLLILGVFSLIEHDYQSREGKSLDRQRRPLKE